jgi:hypothetical protein
MELRNKIVKKELNQSDWEKVHRDLDFVDLFQKVLKVEDSTVVLSGGYSTDASLGEITRPHNDLDIVVYSTKTVDLPEIQNIVDAISRENNKYSILKIELKDMEKFYRPIVVKGKGFWVDVYWVQINKENGGYRVVKEDGTTTEKRKFDYIEKRLMGKSFKVENPKRRLHDIRDKGAGKGTEKSEKFLQDIRNLEMLV